MNQGLRKRALLPIIGVIAAVGMLVAASSASANIVRPAGATPIGASVVIAYVPCTAAHPSGQTLQHNPANLPGAACGPPVAYTPRLTAGDPVVNGSGANFRGNVKLAVTVGPTNVQFPSGAPSNNYVQDVRCTPGYAGANPVVCGAAGSANVLLAGGASPNPDYTGALNVVAYIRITDQANSGPAGGPYTQDATVQDLAFAVAADCANTASTAIGSTCLPRHASAQALCGCVASGKRSNIEVGVGNSAAGAASSLPTGAIFGMDGGNDGVVPDLIADTDSPAPYTRQGLFLP
jgi:hypothetical protein